MAKARYYKSDGKKGRARALPESLFAGNVNEPVLHAVVTAHLANRRQGTAAGRNRARVRGGSRKPWRQKGTGRARQGTIRAAQWTGGGLAFPPRPHSWRKKVSRKMKALARQSAFSARAAEDRVILIDPPAFEKPATRALVKFLEGIDVGKKVLLLTDGHRPNLVLSARNVQEILVRPFGEESVYDILWSSTVVIERSALDEKSDEGPQGADELEDSAAEESAESGEPNDA